MGLLDFLQNNKQKKDNSLFESLKKAFSEKHEDIKREVVEKHGKSLALLTQYPTQLAAGAMGMVALATNSLPAVQPQSALAIESDKIDSSAFLISDLGGVLPKEVRELTPEEETNISGILSRDFGVKVSAELEGVKLNRSYGLIGAEQHLARYPGDSMGTHFNSAEDSQKYYSSGMAPGLGAWGYFAPSKYDLTQKDIDSEKYYIAVQTFLAPGFHDNVRRYIEFFKYRKMLVVNPENGKAMVVVIGDAGPGESTGKSLGGSPEVMKYLERVDGAQKGPVLYFFIDDSDDQEPLGPIQPK
jgi:hypothetical protein